ncbi:putative androgen-induced protein 1 protein-like [Apostichopus japonicus]|uniref:Putative androgen-induced protein 1 protein-like n=1 Tax=Stichopus japonicus TaxID=307972 RepID=A0A2G8L2B7_STIJA|nr:putative androgen-induced protein 1 protein-like [Apostichopus japonicus]
MGKKGTNPKKSGRSGGLKRQVQDQDQGSVGNPMYLGRRLSLFVIFCYYLFINIYDFGYEAVLLRDKGLVPPEQVKFFPGVLFRSAYMTHINQILQLVYFFWSCITDMVSASAPHSSAGRATVAFRDWFLAAIVFPIGSTKRQLTATYLCSPVASHRYVVVKHKYPSRISGILGAVGFALCYLVWILYLGFAKDIWVYPFLKVLEGPYFILFFAVMTVVLIIFYIIGEKLSSVLGGSEKKVSTAKFD